MTWLPTGSLQDELDGWPLTVKGWLTVITVIKPVRLGTRTCRNDSVLMDTRTLIAYALIALLTASLMFLLGVATLRRKKRRAERRF